MKNQRRPHPGLPLAALLGLLLSLCAACASGSPSTPPVKDWPPDNPAQPGRLVLQAPAEADPLLWWKRNILSLVPASIYQDSAQAEEARRFVDATNAKRLAAGLDPVELMPELSRVAQAQAMDEGIRNYWNHRNPEGLGSHDRILAAGLGTVASGAENSAVARPGQSSVEAVVDEFSVHPGHRELLYNPDVRYIGVGIYNYNPAEHVHYVQLLVSF